MSVHQPDPDIAAAPDRFPGGAVVQLVQGDPRAGRALVAELHPAMITVTAERVTAGAGNLEWSWLATDLLEVLHASDERWSLLVVPGVSDHGVAVPAPDVPRLRQALDRLSSAPDGGWPRPGSTDRPEPPDVSAGDRVGAPPAAAGPAQLAPPMPLAAPADVTVERAVPAADPRPPAGEDVAEPRPIARQGRRARWSGARRRAVASGLVDLRTEPAMLEARSISAWFGSHHVLDRVSLEMPAGKVTALIGPSGCGKSTFLRILNRMHELIPSASMSGEVLLAGGDIYETARKVTEARRQVGMVFQKPNPFPAMSIYDNVVASLRLTGVRATTGERDDLVESCLRRAGLWKEVQDRLRQPGGGLSGGQQQRLCIARALAIRPRVLLMDEPCSALDPTSTRRIEQTIQELGSEITIVIVTHNMQQAARVSDRCAFFLAEAGAPGVIIEHGPTDAMFHDPLDPRTHDYVNGRFG